MQLLFRRAKRDLAYATEAEAAEKNDSTIVAKSMYGLGNCDGLGNDAAGRDCYESIRVHASSIVTSRSAFAFLKLACTRANNAMSYCDVASRALCDLIEADDGGLYMDARTAADEERDDLEAIRLAANRGALVAVDLIKCFIKPLPFSETGLELANLVPGERRRLMPI